jgi:hypothetical protein
MKKIFILMLVSMLAGCALNPGQMKALDGAVCSKIYGTTTTAIGGASKSGAILINGENCSIATQGAK